jgi:hypothetical protein
VHDSALVDRLLLHHDEVYYLKGNSYRLAVSRNPLPL